MVFESFYQNPDLLIFILLTLSLVGVSVSILMVLFYKRLSSNVNFGMNFLDKKIDKIVIKASVVNPEKEKLMKEKEEIEKRLKVMENNE